MRVLQYRGPEVTPAVRPQFEEAVAHLAAGDFRAADVRKLQDRSLYRARLNHADRLIFRFVSWQQETCLLLLELVYNHEYNRSRFLRGAAIDESRIRPVETPHTPALEEVEKLVYLHPQNRYVHFLKALAEGSAKPVVKAFARLEEAVLANIEPVLERRQAGLPEAEGTPESEGSAASPEAEAAASPLDTPEADLPESPQSPAVPPAAPSAGLQQLELLLQGADQESTR